MPYRITLRSRTDKGITGWYDGSDSRWSTDYKRQKLFEKKRVRGPLQAAAIEEIAVRRHSIQKFLTMCELAHTSPRNSNHTWSAALCCCGFGMSFAFGGCRVENRSLEPERAEGRDRPTLARGEPPA